MLCDVVDLELRGVADVRRPAVNCSSSAVISSSLMGSANFSEMALNSASSAMVSPSPCSTLPRTSLLASSSGSCDKKPILIPGCGRACPSNSGSTPAMIRSRVDFPAPFSPRTPILAPGKKLRLISRRMNRFGDTTLESWFVV